jgi:hypothetical protein
LPAAQSAGSCRRIDSVKGGAGQPLMSLVITLPPLPMGTVAADGRYAVGPAASWLAGLFTAPPAAAPSVPRLVTELPASPNVYHSSGAGTAAASGQEDGEGGGEGLLDAMGDGEGDSEALALCERKTLRMRPL